MSIINPCVLFTIKSYMHRLYFLCYANDREIFTWPWKCPSSSQMWNGKITKAYNGHQAEKWAMTRLNRTFSVSCSPDEKQQKQGQYSRSQRNWLCCFLQDQWLLVFNLLVASREINLKPQRYDWQHAIILSHDVLDILWDVETFHL